MATDTTPKPLRALDPFVHPQLDDYLHQKTAFVEHFYELITESVNPPFAISVDGLWGSGKTTVMKLLQNRLDARWRITDATLPILKEAGVVAEVLDRLRDLKIRPCYKDEDEFVLTLTEQLGPRLGNYQDKILDAAKISDEAPRFPTFWFSPWEYQKADDIVLAFLQQFARTVYGRYGEGAMKAARLLSVVALLGLDITLKTVSTLAAPIKVDLSLDSIQKTAERLEKDWNTQYENYDDVMQTIKKEFRELVGWISRKEKNPVVIFFDDLDRCLPDTAIQLLEAVKNLFVIPNTRVIFVCGIDTHIAKQFIIAHYRGIEDTFAINYFRKIFNLTIAMPSGLSLLELLKAHIQDTLGWEDAQAQQLANIITTRGKQAEMGSVRKYLNVVNTFYAFCCFNPTYEFTPAGDIVAHLLILKEAWQPLYEELTQEAIKDSLEVIPNLVERVSTMYADREEPLQTEQEKYLKEYLVDPFPSVKLGDDVLFTYPTLA